MKICLMAPHSNCPIRPRQHKTAAIMQHVSVNRLQLQVLKYEDGQKYGELLKSRSV